jgi:hypothetical protein
MNIDDLTTGDAKKLATILGGGAKEDTAFEVGRAYLIRTPTVYHLGRVVRITSAELVLDDAGWVADTGLFSKCLAEGTVSEYEPMGNGVIVPRVNISDASPWKHPLPKGRK